MRSYRRKTERSHYGDERLRAADETVHRGQSLIAVYNEYEIQRRTKLAGREWLSGFMKRHPDLTKRLPTSTSLSRMNGFNQKAITLFGYLQGSFGNRRVWIIENLELR